MKLIGQHGVKSTTAEDIIRRTVSELSCHSLGSSLLAIVQLPLLANDGPAATLLRVLGLGVTHASQSGQPIF